MAAQGFRVWQQNIVKTIREKGRGWTLREYGFHVPWLFWASQMGPQSVKIDPTIDVKINAEQVLGNTTKMV